MVGTTMRYIFRDDHTSSLSETMKIGAFADRIKKHFDEPQLDLPFCTFFADRISLNEHHEESEPQSLTTSPKSDRLSEKNIGVDDLATQQQKTDSEKNEKNGNLATQQEVSMVSTGDDFIMKTPFAKPSGEKFELTKFFREWQQAPLLETFKELPPVEATDLQKQLETFESDLDEFDSIVQTLCQSSPNNN